MVNAGLCCRSVTGSTFFLMPLVLLAAHELAALVDLLLAHLDVLDILAEETNEVAGIVDALH